MATSVYLSETPASKRRKVRKGTRSCWECRRRKEKCTFGSSTDICIKCHRRGTKCVGQEFPEDISESLDHSFQVGDQVTRVEAIVDRLCRERGNDPETPAQPRRTLTRNVQTPRPASLFTSYLSPASIAPVEKETAGFEILQGNSNQTCYLPKPTSRLTELSHNLYQLLPSREDAARIIESCGSISTLFYQMNVTSYGELDRDGSKSPQVLFERPESTNHPTLIARYMLYIANLLQHLHPASNPRLYELSESPDQITDRLTKSACSLVIANDDLVTCVEGIECMMIQSWFQVNGGNLRKALITVRRAITIAQLMNFHRPGDHTKCKYVDSKTKVHPQFLWFRCVSLERHICMMLGLPQATLDQSMASKEHFESDIPMGRLERRHCVIASRILERNSSNQSFHNYSLTREIDRDLQKAAAELPCRWWLAADLAIVRDQPDALFWEMRRLFHQLYHYNLLVQLHLPYMVNSSTDPNFYYSRIACVNAAREVLVRFLAFRNFNHFACSCRTYDFFGLMAGMTLLIAHLEEHRRSAATRDLLIGQPAMTPDNLLAHQRPGDRALVEQIQESMEQASRIDDDILRTESSDLLSRLMKIEDIAMDNNSSFWKDSPGHAASEPRKVEADPIHLQIPHLGAIQITSNGVISNFSNSRTSSKDLDRTGPDFTGNDACGQARSPNHHDATLHPVVTNSGGLEDCSHSESSIQLANDLYGQVATPPISQCSNFTDGFSMMRGDDHLPTDGTDDWILQGVDVAFFDNLMRWNGDGGNCDE
ncbi:hypothetical protein N7541_004766 [Penicillium brevicompactum]|uniref:Zn(2)-C6 fungal-type domain-containing protein n=1 Tax=Penicillium brevicompactum TaxID=5074 RepID=A0A9W9UU62_PENBR|nr:hypothetical protein N7541_004766 [Penicillium brevicompactum]